MTDETTTEQLAEIEGQGDTIQVREGRWRTRRGDIRNVKATPDDDDRATEYPWYDARYDQTWASNGRCYLDEENQRDLVEYLGPIEKEPQPQAEPEPQPEQVQVREGRWRTRNGEIKNIRPCEPLKGAYYVWPWTDGFMTFQDNGRHLAAVSDNDLVEYLGPIEEQPEAQPEPKPEADPVPQEQPESDAELRIRLLKQANDSQAETIGRLLTEARDLNMEIGGLERRLSERDARIRDLETMHAAATQAVVDAGKQNDALRLQLAAVKAELANVAADRQQLRIELDAAQQVPADSLELRQLRADLAEVGHDRDMYRHEHELLVQDIDATHQRTKAETVEAIVEWLEPIRREDPHLRAVILFHLPKIIRSLTGLNSND